MEGGRQKKHIILIHGACLGAWCWHKLKPLLERAGHRVTAVDLAASGVNMKTIHELQTLRDYTEPLLQLMETVPPEEKVVVVGHSLGGLSLALAMEKFPQRIEAAIFLSAFMPDTVHQPSYVLEQFSSEMAEGYWLDTQFACHGKPEESFTTMFFGPKFLSLIYDPAPAEDFELAMLLRRPSSFFLHDLSKAKKFSADRYGLVKRVYVVCEADKAIPVNFQRWMINNGGVKQVKVLKGSGHMPMVSMPEKLCDCLVDIVAEKCA
ncbi:hypothetical protein Nepgr_016604 [Nepenthes gracilis]|uniref:AB hydrolase-1 domain-containing protein n=1 Tax=Nepenthes gracilis TaxID=150966 RepID=A0AAD3SN09_NEPGR|nr:hypothetical protein Nepgr_016604 [Nepenthes gracilis]